MWDSILRIGGVVALLPRFGMKGFLAVILLSSLYTCAANTGHLLFSSGTQHAFRRWLGAPALAAVLAAAAGMALRKLLADGFAARLPLQLAALGIGGCATTGVSYWRHGRWALERKQPRSGLRTGPADRKNRGSLAADSNFLDILQCSEYNIKIGLSGVPDAL